MLPKFFRVVLAVTSSALFIPYAFAFMAEMLYGKPKRTAEDLLKSLHPTRVFTFTKSFLRDLRVYKYTGLYFKWTKHYNSLSSQLVLKDIEYGHNHNTLDIYKPPQFPQKETLRAVVVFVYGGTWSSGDKNMYSLLCTSLAQSLNSLILCPNYSIYPKGYVDDMVQDVSDVIIWAREHAPAYNADPAKIVLLGHSAGAHLVALTTLELSMKYLKSLPGMVAQKLQEKEQKVPDAGQSFPISYVDDSTSFLDTYFTQQSPQQAANLSIIHGANDPITNEGGANDPITNEGGDNEDIDVSIIREEGGGDLSIIGDEKDTVLLTPTLSNTEAGKETDFSTASPATESFVIVAHTDKQAEAGSGDPAGMPGEDTHDVLKGIRLVIGMAGVYDIREQYKHQESHAREHTSNMARAMYDQDHFDDFSPTHAIKHIPPPFELPPFWLLHGDNDSSVPVSSSLSFAEALWKRQCKAVHVSLLRGCDHHEVCLDLMSSDLKWHYSLLGELQRAFIENGL